MDLVTFYFAKIGLQMLQMSQEMKPYLHKKI